MAKNRIEILATIISELECEKCGHIKKGFFLDFSIPRFFDNVLKNIGVGIKVRVDIFKWYKKRTNKQNATSWGPDYQIIRLFLSEKAGEIWTDEEIHDFHKKKFLGYEESAIAEGLLKPKSTTDLDTFGWSVFREDYCRFWAGVGCYIPDPKKRDGE